MQVFLAIYYCDLYNNLMKSLLSQPRGFWKSELKEKLGQKSDSVQGNDGPLLVEILESYLKLQVYIFLAKLKCLIMHRKGLL